MSNPRSIFKCLIRRCRQARRPRTSWRINTITATTINRWIKPPPAPKPKDTPPRAHKIRSIKIIVQSIFFSFIKSSSLKPWEPNKLSAARIRRVDRTNQFSVARSTDKETNGYKHNYGQTDYGNGCGPIHPPVSLCRVFSDDNLFAANVNYIFCHKNSLGRRQLPASQTLV